MEMRFGMPKVVVGAAAVVVAVVVVAAVVFATVGGGTLRTGAGGMPCFFAESGLTAGKGSISYLVSWSIMFCHMSRLVLTFVCCSVSRVGDTNLLHTVHSGCATNL